MHAKRTRTRGRVEGNRPNSVRYIIWIWAVIALAIAAALLWGPRKPEAPPSSSISYDDAPRSVRDRERGVDFDVAASVPEPPEVDVDATLSREAFVVHGAVTNAATGKAVIRAKVQCRRVVPPEEAEALQAQLDEARNAGDMDRYTALLEPMQGSFEGYTDTRGRFAVNVGSPGDFEVVASHVGFLEARADASVTDARPKVSVDLKLPVGARISGRVTEADSGKPAPGIEIVCEGANVGAVKTDEDGAYTISGLSPGQFRVSLNLRHSPYQVRGRAPQHEVAIDTPDEHVKDIDFVVNPAGIVWGYVYGPNKEAVSHVEVVLCSSASIVSQVIDSAMNQVRPIVHHSEEDGYYELIGVPLNQAWQVMGLGSELAPQLSEEFVLTEKNRSVRVDLYMLPGTTVYGTVISSVDGSPVPGANVLCIPSYGKFFSPLDSPQAIRDAQTDENGAFTVADLPRGEFQLLVQKDGFKLAAMGTRISPDGIQDIRGIKVPITPVKSGEYAIYGYVMDTAGNPVAGADLSLAGFGMMGASVEDQKQETDSSGYFIFEGVDPGMFMLEVRAEGYAPQSVGNVLLDQENDIYLEAIASIAGRVVVRETGEPLTQFSLRVSPLTASGSAGLFQLAEMADARSYNDPNGEFSIDVGAGDYRLEATAPGLTAGRTNVELQPGQRLTNVTIYVSQSGGTIQGRVRMADGSNPQGAVAILADASSQLQNIFAFAEQLEGGGNVVGADGVFEFTGLPEGVYSVSARLQGYAPGQSGPIQVRPGRSASSVEIVLGAGGSLQGYVYKDGAVETGAVITVVGNGVSQVATSDRNGFYTIDHLPAGTYMASKMSMGSGNLLAALTPVHARVEIQEGQTTLYNFGDECDGGSVRGYTNVSLTIGQMAFAILSLPGSELELENVNFTNPLEWFSGNSSLVSAIMDVRPLGPDGSFIVDCLPQGSYVLTIFQMSPGQLLSGGANAVYQELIDVGTEPVELQIDVE